MQLAAAPLTHPPSPSSSPSPHAYFHPWPRPRPRRLPHRTLARALFPTLPSLYPHLHTTSNPQPHPHQVTPPALHLLRGGIDFARLLRQCYHVVAAAGLTTLRACACTTPPALSAPPPHARGQATRAAAWPTHGRRAPGGWRGGMVRAAW